MYLILRSRLWGLQRLEHRLHQMGVQMLGTVPKADSVRERTSQFLERLPCSEGAEFAQAREGAIPRDVVNGLIVRSVISEFE